MLRYLYSGLLLLPLSSAKADERAVPAAQPSTEGRPSLVLDTGGHTSTPLKACFSRNGKRLATCSRDKTVQVWDVESGQRLAIIRPPTGTGEMGTPHWLAVDETGERVAFGVEVGDLNRPVAATFLCSAPLWQGRKLANVIGAMAFTADGRALAVGRDCTVRLIEVASGKQLARADLPRRGKQGHHLALAFSPDGTTLAAVTRDRRLFVLDGASLTIQKTLEAPSEPAELFEVGWADGNTLLTRDHSAGDACVHIWDLGRAQVKKTFSLRQLTPELPDGQFKGLRGATPIVGTTRAFVTSTVLKGGKWISRGSVFDWQREQWNKALEIREMDHSVAGAISPDGALAALGCPPVNDIVLFDALSGKEARRLGAPAHGAAPNAKFSPDGKSIAWAALDGVRPYPGALYPALQYELNLTTLELRRKPVPAFKTYTSGLVETRGQLAVKQTDPWTVQIAGGPAPVTYTIKPSFTRLQAWGLLEGDRIVVATYSNFVRIVDTATGKVVHDTQVVNSHTRGLAVSPDGRYVLVGSPDQTLVLLSAATGKVLLTVFAAGRDWVVWTPEGYYAASPGGEKLMGWTVNNGTAKLATFYAASRFRASLYRPDVIQRLLDEGSTEKALEAADKVRGARRSKTLDIGEVLPPRVSLTAPGLTSPKVTQPTVEIEAVAEGVGRYPVVAPSAHPRWEALCRRGRLRAC